MMDATFYSWIQAHLNDDTKALRLKYAGKTEPIDYAAAITQIECRQRFGKKLEQTLAADPVFFFPSVLAGEQATADVVAAFHSTLVCPGETVADLTAGLGIDIFHISRIASATVAVERDHERAQALRINAASLGIDNIAIVEADCTQAAGQWADEGRRFDTIFIDPARRAGDGSRVFALSDCEPDVEALLPRLKTICRRIIIKASPMLDVTHTAETLSARPERIMAVGTPTECKELLIVADLEADTDNTIVEGVTLHGGTASRMSFTLEEERRAPMPEAMRPLGAGDYIYEAWPAVMKTGAFKVLAQRYNLQGFHANTRLLASTALVKGFPGNAYRIEAVYPYASRVLKRFRREYPRINVAVRNFGMSADALRTKLGVSDGGELRLYGLTDARGERVLAVVK